MAGLTSHRFWSSALVLGLAISVPLDAKNEFNAGDLVVGGFVTLCPNAQPPRVRQFGVTGEIVADLANGASYAVNDLAFTRSGMLLVLTSNGILLVGAAADGLVQLGPTFENATAMTPDAWGNVLVVNQSQVGQNELLRIDSSGNVGDRWQLPGCCQHISSIDLAKDQCNLYYADNDFRVFRFDLCLGTPLAPIELTTFVSTVRLLPDSTLLVAAPGVSLRIAESGTVLQSYPLNSLAHHALAVAADGASFWTVGVTTPSCEPVSSLYRFDLATGALLLGPIDVGFGTDALAIAGEPRPLFVPQSVPTTTEWVSLALALSLALVGWKQCSE